MCVIWNGTQKNLKFARELLLLLSNGATWCCVHFLWVNMPSVSSSVLNSVRLPQNHRILERTFGTTICIKHKLMTGLNISKMAVDQLMAMKVLDGHQPTLHTNVSLLLEIQLWIVGGSSKTFVILWDYFMAHIYGFSRKSWTWEAANFC